MLPQVASRLKTQNQQSEVHLEPVANHSEVGSRTGGVCSSPQETCVSHQSEPVGEHSI